MINIATRTALKTIKHKQNQKNVIVGPKRVALGVSYRVHERPESTHIFTHI